MNKPQVLLIVGPTAVGKTALSLKLAKQLNGEIISGDSMQVYRHLDIGTAKVTAAERGDIPHFLIDEREVTQGFTVADFVDRASTLIDEIHQRQHLPIIVGGTGFYLQALLQGLHLGVPASEKIRQHWQKVADENGLQTVWQELNHVDPVAAKHIPVGNLRRVIRALEVYQLTGHSIEDQEDTPDLYDSLIIGLNTDRGVLYQRINQRVDNMMAAGLLSEAHWLYDQDGKNLQAGRGIGYKELFPYFDGTTDLATVTATLKQNSRHYAKRQLTWFRHQLPVNCFDLVAHPEEVDQILQLVTDWQDN